MTVQCVIIQVVVFFLRKYWSLEESTIDTNGMISNFLKLIRSSPFFKLLRVFTDLDLALLGGEDEKDGDDGDVFEKQPSCVVDTRQWKHGGFTILDDGQFKGESCLDCVFNVGCEGICNEINFREDFFSFFFS